MATTDPGIQSILTELASDSAKRRERVIHDLTPTELASPQVVEALQNIVSRDPAEYVRTAAREKLVSIGQVPAESAAPLTIKEEGAKKPAIFALGLTGGIIAVIGLCLVLVCVAAFLLAGPNMSGLTP